MADLGSVGFDSENPDYNLRLSYIVAAMPLTKSVSGNIYDDTNAAAARTVRLYNRTDGRFLGETISDAGDGSYSLIAPVDEVQRIVLDDDAGDLYNDLIDRVIPGP